MDNITDPTGQVAHEVALVHVAHLELHAAQTVPLRNWPTGQLEAAQVLVVVNENPVAQVKQTVVDEHVTHGLEQALQDLRTVSAKNPAKHAFRHYVPVELEDENVLVVHVKQLFANYPLQVAQFPLQPHTPVSRSAYPDGHVRHELPLEHVKQDNEALQAKHVLFDKY